MEAKPKKEVVLCVVEGCGKPKRALGYCMGHYQRVRNTGDLKKPLSKDNRKVEPEVAIATRVTLETRAILMALAEQHEQSFYQLTSEVLSKYAAHWRDSVQYEGHLKRLEREMKLRRKARIEEKRAFDGYGVAG
jgi:hypothetical protein